MNTRRQALNSSTRPFRANPFLVATAIAGSAALATVVFPEPAFAQLACPLPLAGSGAVTCVATSGNANATVNTISTATPATRGLSVTAPGNATATISGDVTTAGANSDAVVVTGGGDALVTVATGGSVRAAGGNSITLNSVTGSTLNNAGTIGNNAAGVGVLALGGPITINNTGSLTSAISLTAGADRVNNSGTFVVGANPAFGAGTDVFNNSGTVILGSSAAASISSNFTGLESFNNDGGIVDLANGRTGDVLVLPGSFAATGNSRLAVDAQVGTALTVDRLVIGGAASGNTTIILTQVPGSTPQFNSGAVVVQAGAASSSDAFALPGGFTEQGYVRYEVGYNPNDFSFSLTGAPSDAAFRTLNFTQGARNLWLKSADAVSGQLRAQRDNLWALGGGEPSPRLWLQIHGSIEDRQGGRQVNSFGQSREVNSGFQQDYFGGQVGLDLGGGSGERGGFAVGVTGGYVNSTMKFHGVGDQLKFDAVNAGVYASFSTGNIFLNGLAKYDYYWADLNSASAGISRSFKGHSYGARGEVGLRFGNESFFVEPAASFSYLKTKFRDFAVLGTQVSFDEDDGMRGRAGARIGGQFDMLGSKAAFYLGGNYVREFKSQDGVTFTSGGQTLSFVNTRPKEYGEGVLGISIGQTNGVSGFIEGTYIRSFSDEAAGRRPIEGAGGRGGLRVRF